jgi:hypothetical protein
MHFSAPRQCSVSSDETHTKTMTKIKLIMQCLLTTRACVIHPKNTFNSWSSRNMRTKSEKKDKLI